MEISLLLKHIGGFLAPKMMLEEFIYLMLTMACILN
jgi:hypothetical protein